MARIFKIAFIFSFLAFVPFGYGGCLQMNFLERICFLFLGNHTFLSFIAQAISLLFIAALVVSIFISFKQYEAPIFTIACFVFLLLILTSITPSSEISYWQLLPVYLYIYLTPIVLYSMTLSSIYKFPDISLEKQFFISLSILLLIMSFEGDYSIYDDHKLLWANTIILLLLSSYILFSKSEKFKKMVRVIAYMCTLPYLATALLEGISDFINCNLI
jgi:hypothetical protein